MSPLSIWDLIAERETAAATVAEQLRAQIAALTEQLATAEAELADLAITRKTLTVLTTGDSDVTPPADATVASAVYQQILAVFAAATGALRAKDVCLALDLGVTPKDTEGIRAKLKRLVTRNILAETERGLFALAPPTTPTQPRQQDL